jgi:hypothetical protein
MSHASARKLAAILWLALAGMVGTAWAQNPELPRLALTGRVVFGAAELSEGHNNEGGPAATIEADLSGYWRDPRILQFEFKPMITLGHAVAGTEMGNAMTGFAATGIFLQGSSFPLTISYSKSVSSLEQGSGYANPSQGVLSGAENNMESTVFDANWTLRFRHLMTDLDYSDTDHSSELPAAFGTADDYTQRNFTAQVNYNYGGWQAGARYQFTQSTTKFPNVISGGVGHDDGNTTDLDFIASRLLPLHSTLGVTADRSKSSYNFDGTETNTTVDIANASLTSQPLEKLTTSMQAQYTSNLQAFQEQQAIATAGISGVASIAPASTTSASQVPLTFLAAPFKVLTLSWAAGLQLGNGFSLNGSYGESFTSNSGTSTRWSIGPAYQHKWRTGSLAASYSHTGMATQADVVSETDTTDMLNTTQGTAPYSLYSETTNLDNVAVDMNQNLPREFQLATSVHVSEGTIKDNGIPYPDHDYGGRAFLTRPLGGWTLIGSFSLEKNAADTQLLNNRSTSEGISFGAACRGLSLTAGRLYGSGLALQVGNSLAFIPNPVVAGAVVGATTLSSTTGSTLAGSYRSRRGRVVLMGNWGRFNYNTNNFGTQNTLLNLQASYKLRHLRLIAGFMKQSQVYSIGSLGTYDTRLIYFQVERLFRVF